MSIDLLRRRMMVNKPSSIEDIYPLIAPLREGSETDVLSTYETAVSLGTIDIVDAFNRSLLSRKKYIYTISNNANSFTTPNADCVCVYHEKINGVLTKHKISGNTTHTPTTGSTERYVIVCGDISTAVLPVEIEWLFTGFCSTHKGISGCKIKHIHISDYYTTLATFWDVGSSLLGRLIIPEWITSIPYRCFHSKNISGALIIHDKVTTLGSQCFYNTKVTSIYVGQSVKSESQSIYSSTTCTKLELNCPLLKTLTTNLNAMLFCDMPALEEIVLRDSEVFVLDNGVLYYKDWCLTSTKTIPTDSLIIKQGTTNILKSAFASRKFTSTDSCGTLQLPNTLIKIGSSAFNNCKLKGNLTIPDSVVSIDSAFNNIPTLTGKLTLNKSITSISGFNNIPFTGDLIIPEGVTSINNAFGFVTGFTGDLIIPEGVTSINNAFTNCGGSFYGGEIFFPSTLTKITNYRNFETGARTIRCAAAAPPLVDKWMGSRYTVYVPSASLGLYQEADYWKDATLIGY